MIKIALADDEALFRKGMAMILEEHENIQIILEAENGEDLLEKLGCRNVAGLVIYAIQNELVTIHPDQFWGRNTPGI